jgi:LysR family transcriptional regulator, low CO2-responsive transcriptional regulator
MLYEQLRAFHAVATEGGFTRAAEALHRTQPAVSAQVKALESRYGVALFERMGRGVAITEFGKRLLDITRRMFELEQEADRALRSARTSSSASLKLAADAPYSLGRLLGVYGQQQPQVRISVAMGTGEAILRDLLAREADAAVLVRVQPDPRFELVPYGRHRVVAIVARNHPWAKRSALALKDLDGKPMIMRDTRFSLTSQIFEEALRERRIKPDLGMRVDSRENLREAVAAGMAFGVTAEPDAIADRRLRVLHFRDADLAIADYLVCLKERRTEMPIEALLRLAAQRPTEPVPGGKGKRGRSP